MRYARLEDIRDAVEENGGVLTLSMEELRDAHGAERLGVNVRSAITSRLRKLGLNHQPYVLPAYQEDTIRLYLADSAVAKLLQAVSHTGPRWDKVLREAANSDASEVLHKVRELVK